MLTNEQRAHDLAIATLPFVRDIVKSQIIEGKDAKFDAYFEYIKLYNQFLSAVSE
ncbi:TPA: hypothetical protein MB070_001101, partial [Enterococcus faecium]|nr:hypothetical protein [Enterococcus faecium]